MIEIGLSIWFATFLMLVYVGTGIDLLVLLNIMIA
jgi:hypothetical protein